MSESKKTSEFRIIDTYFKPLAENSKGALGLTDDAALLDIPSDQQLVVTMDSIVCGVHFLATQSASDIAHKLVGVNISDLAAMGAKPYGVFMAAQFPKGTSPEWYGEFAGGLGEALADCGATLMGGDTVSTPGPLSLTLTALGLVPQNRALTRAGAQVGDDIYVSGTIGDGALGLLCATDKYPGDAFLNQRYTRPQPRWKLGMALSESGFVNACCDVSDGLMADLRHICTTSKVSGEVIYGDVPSSSSVQKMLLQHPQLNTLILTGGDDYELLFTANPSHRVALNALSDRLNIAVTRIGTITSGFGTVSAKNADGKDIDFGAGGYEHL